MGKTIKDRQNNHKSICYLHTRLSFLFFRSNFAARNVVLEQTFISGTLKTKYLTNYTEIKNKYDQLHLFLPILYCQYTKLQVSTAIAINKHASLKKMFTPLVMLSVSCLVSG